jgi:hypothetical protein
MGGQKCDGNGRPATCRTLASAASPIQGNNQLIWMVWGGGDKREGHFGGVTSQKRVKVVLIEWRSFDLQSIDSKSTFHPPQSGKCTGPYSTCVLGLKLRYWHHGKHVYPFRGKPSKARQPLFWTDQPTNQPAAEELKYSHDRALWCQHLTKNMSEVWQNLAIFGRRPIGGTIEALLTKVINWQY